MDRKSFFLGIFFIFLGLVFLADNFGLVDISWDSVWEQIEVLWPLAVIGFGLLFWASWWKNRTDYSQLMPGTIFVVYGLLFLYCSLEGWWHMGRLWPVFLIGPGLGFFAMFLLGRRETGLLVAGCCFTGFGVLFLIGIHDWGLLWPLILIAIGLGLIFRQRRSHPSPPETKNADTVR
ncbi:MAG: hypothetical protein D6681_01265 [Calditrichaeota bacterium]|nr:MAG: hypothetical protein D6681_01265 [Calditrichota bacterium]